MNKAILLLVGIVWSVGFFAQDPVFNQTDNSRNYLNPAYIGTEKSFSADLNYRNQWPELSGNYKTLAFQVNQYLGKGNGVSIHFVNDNAANTVMKSEFGLGYAKQFHLASKHHISFGAQVSYFQKTINWDKLTFGNMIDPQTGFVYPINEPVVQGTKKGLDFNVGVVYYCKHFFVSYSAKHITRPIESLTSNFGLPIRHGVDLGGKITWKEVAFIPSLRLFQQGTFQTAFATVKVKFAFLEVDAGIQNKNGFFGGVGFYSEHFNIGYNYTIHESRLGFRASTHEIRLGCDLMLFKKENEHFFNF